MTSCAASRNSLYQFSSFRDHVESKEPKYGQHKNNNKKRKLSPKKTKKFSYEKHK